MATLFIIGWILVGYLIAATICICFQELLVALCDWAFLEADEPDGVVDVGELKRLWNSPTDGAECVRFDGEGGWRLARSDAERPARS